MSIFGKDDNAIAKFSETLPIPEFPQCDFNTPKPLNASKVAIVTTAALHQDGGGFALGDSDHHYETLSSSAKNLKLGHHSVNFDRGGFAADHNVVYPIDRLEELADIGIIGEVATHHYSFAGNQSASVSEIRLDSGPLCASEMHKEQVDVVLLTGT